VNKNGYKKFNNYKGSINLAAGLIPNNTDNHLLILSSNVQVDEEGHSLYDLIESDEFNGEDGKTPEKGVDYFTPEDVAEIVEAVKNALPIYNGEVADI
jgi:hypothetical protein